MYDLRNPTDVIEGMKDDGLDDADIIEVCKKVIEELENK